MRGRDLIPVVLLGGMVAFFVVQLAGMRRAPGRADVRRQEAISGSLNPQGRPQESSSEALVHPTSAAPASAAMPVIELRRSSDPAPRRDDAEVRMLIRDGAQSTYILGMLQQRDQLLMRWPDRRLDALRVWIERDASVPDWQAEYPVVAERVFDEWRVAGFPLRFDIVLDSATSDIKIQWVTQFSASDGRAIGRTTQTRDQHGWIVDAEIVIAIHDVQGNRIPPEFVAGIARHEVGHALGLGHSDSPDDVMYPQSSTPIISNADRATLNLVYRLPPGIIK